MAIEAALVGPHGVASGGTRFRSQFQCGVADGASAVGRRGKHERSVRRRKGAPATYAIHSKADIRLQHNICRAGPKGDIGRTREIRPCLSLGAGRAVPID